MLEAFALPAINRLLRTNSWAPERLRAHAGKTARLVCPPGELRLTVTEAGAFATAASSAAPDVTIFVTPGLVLRGAAGDTTAWHEAQVSGDAEFAATIDYLRRHLVWDYEEDLSRVVGDVAAHRIANVAREADRWGRTALTNLAGAFAEYATYEAPILAAPAAVEAFNREVDELRDAVARLEKRVELLQRRVAE